MTRKIIALSKNKIIFDKHNIYKELDDYYE